jgi:hypothetical protein
LGLFVERNFKCPSWLTMLWPSAISSKLKSSFADCTGLTRNFTLRCMIKATGRTKHSLEEMRIMVNYVLFMLCFKKKKKLSDPQSTKYINACIYMLHSL